MSFTWLPGLIFVACVPLLAYFLYSEEPSSQKVATVGITLIITFAAISFGEQISLPWSILYAIILTIAFASYAFTNGIIPNRLGLLTLAIYICTAEYLAIRIAPEYTGFLLGGVLEGMPDIHKWSTGVGIIGVSAWIVVTNLWIARIFSPDRKGSFGSKLVLLIYPIIVMSIPALISLFGITDNQSLAVNDLKQQLEAGLADSVPLEKLGRTCAWVSGFIVVYALVQFRIKKK